MTTNFLLEVSLDAYAEAILAQARAMPPGKLVLVGHSMGGAAITAAASRRPDLFARLVYLCAFVPRPGKPVATLPQEGYALGHAGPQAAPALQAGKPVSDFNHIPPTTPPSDKEFS